MRKTQCEIVLDYLQDGGRLTNRSAMSELGIGRLASRICDLRQQGYEIKGVPKKVDNRYGGKSTVTEYYIEGQQ